MSINNNETAHKLLFANVIALEKTQDIIRNEVIEACAELLIRSRAEYEVIAL